MEVIDESLLVEVFYTSANSSSSSLSGSSPAEILVQRIISEHNTVKQLYSQYPNLDAASKLDTGRKIIELIVQHAGREECVLYPAMRKIPELGDKAVNEAIAEHQQTTNDLYELSKLNKADSKFDTQLQKIMKELCDHIAEEESSMLPLFISGASNYDAQQILNDYQNVTVTSLPHPWAPREGLPAKAAHMASVSNLTKSTRLPLHPHLLTAPSSHKRKSISLGGSLTLIQEAPRSKKVQKQSFNENAASVASAASSSSSHASFPPLSRILCADYCIYVTLPRDIDLKQPGNDRWPLKSFLGLTHTRTQHIYKLTHDNQVKYALKLAKYGSSLAKELNQEWWNYIECEGLQGLILPRAPFFGTCTIGGERYTILVTDYVGPNISQYISQQMKGGATTGSSLIKLRDEIAKAACASLRILHNNNCATGFHKANYLHGDIRLENFTLQRDDTNELKAYIIDLTHLEKNDTADHLCEQTEIEKLKGFINAKLHL